MFELNNALILAGGFGTRLQSVIKDVPKPMASVRGEPFLAHLIRHYKSQGITQFVLSVGYKAEIIQNYFGNYFESAAIEYLCETRPLGTGGAIKYALDHLPDEWMPNLILNGDTWFEPNLLELTTFSQARNSPICLSLKQIESNDRYGSVELDLNGLVRGFCVEPSGNCVINVGCYYVDAIALKGVLKEYPETFSFEADCLPALARSGLVSGYVWNAKFLDIGIPADYAKVDSLFS